MMMRKNMSTITTMMMNKNMNTITTTIIITMKARMSTPTMPIMPMKAMATITSTTTIIITMKVRLRNMASAPTSILPAAP